MLEQMVIDENGWVCGVEHIPSPNYELRPKSKKIKLIVVHAISLPPGEYGGGYIQQFFTNKLDAEAHKYFEEISQMRVSAHCLISRNGEIVQFVSFIDRAWHAGESCWNEEENCNDYSIGIELEGCDTDTFEECQYEKLAILIHSLQCKYPHITERAICGHNDIAPDRKTDPGPLFDWQKLRLLLKSLS